MGTLHSEATLTLELPRWGCGGRSPFRFCQ